MLTTAWQEATYEMCLAFLLNQYSGMRAPQKSSMSSYPRVPRFLSGGETWSGKPRVDRPPAKRRPNQCSRRLYLMHVSRSRTCTASCFHLKWQALFSCLTRLLVLLLGVGQALRKLGGHFACAVQCRAYNGMAYCYVPGTIEAMICLADE